MPKTIHEQVIDYLTDMHSIEVQALPQMRAAPKIAGDDRARGDLPRAQRETESHERLIRERLEELEAKPSLLKGMVKLTGGRPSSCSRARSRTRPASWWRTRSRTSTWSSRPTSC